MAIMGLNPLRCSQECIFFISSDLILIVFIPVKLQVEMKYHMFCLFCECVDSIVFVCMEV